jgi:tellurite methyltransferase
VKAFFRVLPGREVLPHPEKTRPTGGIAVHPEQMDRLYRQPGFYWGTEPNRLAHRLLEFLPSVQGKTVVDLGCGEGRDAVFFAKNGLEVIAVDLSQAGLDKAKRWAEAEGASLTPVRADLLSYRLNTPVDAVYSIGALHYLPPGIRNDAFAHYKAMTRPGGIHVFNVFVEKPYIPVPPDYADNEYFYHTGELLQYYRDWEILSFEEFVFDCNSSGIPHRHAVNVMVARQI